MSRTQLPDDDARRFAGLEKDERQDAVGTPSEWAIIGKRTDLAGGVGPRLRIGFDNSSPPAVIIERWSEGGTRTVATFA